MKLAERFISINGEGQRAGELAVFLRFAGCNLCCSYCDTRWANEPDCQIVEVTPAELASYVRETGIRNVTLTGGEPLLQEELPQLVRELLAIPGTRVEIETNGAVSLRELDTYRRICPETELIAARLSFTMDYKLPSSGCEQAMRSDNFPLLLPHDTVKFVSGSAEDLERAAEVIETYDLTSRCKVYISPVFGKLHPREIVEFLSDRKMNDVRLQIQLHKVIWDPKARGV